MNHNPLLISAVICGGGGGGGGRGWIGVERQGGGSTIYEPFSCVVDLLQLGHLECITANSAQ